MKGEKREDGFGKDSQQCQANITNKPGLQLNLDIQVKAELKTHGLRLCQTRQHGRCRKSAAGRGEGPVVAATAAAAAVGVVGARVRGRVVPGVVAQLPTEVSEHLIARRVPATARGTGVGCAGKALRGWVGGHGCAL